MEETEQEFTAALEAARSRELGTGSTIVGPHRDDLKLKINGQPVESTASRGELRSALMALKQAEIAWFQHKTLETPIILLDDVFSELDTTRKNDTLEPLIHDLSRATQIIMTVAQGNPLPTSPKLKSLSTVRKVHQGQITID
jgi:DNA replication and repair protein RecF